MDRFKKMEGYISKLMLKQAMDKKKFAKGAVNKRKATSHNFYLFFGGDWRL